jgi:hypothetical protein
MPRLRSDKQTPKHKPADDELTYPYMFISSYLGRVQREISRCSIDALAWVLSEDFEDFILAWEASVELAPDYWRRKLAEAWKPGKCGIVLRKDFPEGAYWYTSATVRPSKED